MALRIEDWTGSTVRPLRSSVSAVLVFVAKE